MKILVFNVKYSPNLGDGVLAACLERGLMQGSTDISVETMDLAGRNDFAPQNSRRLLALSVLGMLPQPVRAQIVKFTLERRLSAIREYWWQKIEEADAVIIGGGNLFQDDDLNFPLKLSAVLEGVKRSRKPLAVFAVGVTGDWSKRGQRLFSTLLQCNLVHASVRDEGARKNWLKHFGDAFEVEVCPDPGLLAAGLSQSHHPCNGPPLIGLGVTHPLVLRRHAAIPPAQIPLSGPSDYRLLIRWFIDAGCRVMLFTNGAQEDDRFLQYIINEGGCRANLRDGSLTVMPRPTVPQELVTLLAKPGVIVAHRLHANIVAYALGIPSIGLGWDEKVDNFFIESGRKDYILRGEAITPPQIGEMALHALEEGLDQADQRKNVRKARFSLSYLNEKLRIYSEKPRKNSFSN